jgi:hypothetical protein
MLQFCNVALFLLFVVWVWSLFLEFTLIDLCDRRPVRRYWDSEILKFYCTGQYALNLWLLLFHGKTNLG